MSVSQQSGAVQDKRLEKARNWFSGVVPANNASWSSLAGDASFRRYFRVSSGSKSWVLMDAPPGKEDNRPYMDVTSRLQAAGIRVPRILATNLEQGFLLLEDFGDELLKQSLDAETAAQWFPGLLDLLQRLSRDVGHENLPRYDRALLTQELELFTDWYLARHHDITLDCQDIDTWESLCTGLLSNAADQPQVFVHRDFHSSNLMVLPERELGVIDFQDAVLGPLSYDLVSLLWDRHIRWPRKQLEQWMLDFRERAGAPTDEETWIRWCDWMGLQRNLKIVGIFARLNYRDEKPRYLDLIPRFWQYIEDVISLYPEFSEFQKMLERLKCAP